MKTRFPRPCISGLILATMAAILVLATPLRAANLVQNPGFETGDFTGWTQSGNTAGNLVLHTCFGNAPHSGSYTACLVPVGNPAILLQVLPTSPGALYDVGFWLMHVGAGPFPSAFFDAYWEDTLFYSNPGGASQPYTLHSATLLATDAGGSELRFNFKDDLKGWGLDDVSVIAAPATAPEPSSLVLLAAAGLGLFGAARRRFGRRRTREEQTGLRSRNGPGR